MAYYLNGMSSIGVWVAFLKQPDALPGRAPQKVKKKKLNFICDVLLMIFFGVLHQAVRAV
jgi:hypothetical protein